MSNIILFDGKVAYDDDSLVMSNGGTDVFKNYGFYTCGFSYDGEYFVFAQDAGITLLRRV